MLKYRSNYQLANILSHLCNQDYAFKVSERISISIYNIKIHDSEAWPRATKFALLIACTATTVSYLHVAIISIF